MNLDQFREKMRVRYIPNNVDGNINHSRCLNGTVSTVGSRYVFVKFDRQVEKFGWEEAISEACDPRELIEVFEV